MENTYKIIGFILLLAYSGSYVMAADISFSDPAKSIIVSSEAPTFIITLQSNPSTGFNWYLANYDQNLVEPVSQKYFAPDIQRPGAGGYEQWKFKIKSDGFVVPQVTEIKMLHTRPWELVGSKLLTFNIFIK